MSKDSSEGAETPGQRVPNPAFLRHCASVMRGVLDNCQPKPRQGFHDDTEHVGGQALEELRRCMDELNRLGRSTPMMED